MNASTRDDRRARRVDLAEARLSRSCSRRVRKKSNRPLLQTDDPEAELCAAFWTSARPTYALADLTIESRDGPHDLVVETILRRLAEALCDGGSGRQPERAEGRGAARRTRLFRFCRRGTDRRGGTRNRPNRAWREMRRRHGRQCRAALSRARDGESRPRRARRDRDRLPARRSHQILRGIRARLRRADRRARRAARRRGRARAAGSSAISPAFAPPRFVAASASCKFRRRCSRRSIPASAARRASTRRTARTSSAPSISRRWCWPTPAPSTR